MSTSKTSRMLSKFSALAFAILGLASVLIGVVRADNPVSKELTQVITGIDLLDASDTKQNVTSEGDFSLRTNLAYKLRVTFDLKQYNENLNNGDYFTFDIPAPMTVYNGNQELIDPVTQVAIGEVVVTSNGDDQGGKAKITLKNLDKYLAKTGGDKVKDVSGNFSASFRFLKDQNKTLIKFNSSSMKQEINHIYTSKTISGPKVGTENYAKSGGQASRDNWTSEKLAAIGSVSKGDAASNWRVRVNTEKQDFGQNIVLHDTIPNDDTSYTPAQYIPETLRVYRADITGGTSAVPDDAVLLSEGKEYTVDWNENYTSFDITFKDGTTSYFVTYNTTTPNDGTKVANIAALSLADGTKLAQNTSRPGALSMKAEATSLISGTIVASTAYQIKINKTDAFTLAPVPGAVYTVTAADDASETTEVTTNEKGVALTKTYDQKWEGKTFKIKEKTAPAGYKLDEKEYTVKLGAAGSTINLKDEPVPAVFNVTAKKVVVGRTDKLPKADEFTFNLYTAENLKTPVATAKSKSDGTITFENIELKGAGTYRYIIKEDTSKAIDGITFDEEGKEVTVTAAFQGGVLKASVTSAEPTFTNTYKAASTSATIKAKKVLNGKELVADAYTFELKEKDAVVATAKNTASGEVAFTVTYTEAGEHTYTITEKSGTESGVTYSTESHTVKVNVVDNGQGQLVATVENPEAERIFTNTYKAASTSATIKAKKVLTGKELVADVYTFELKEKDAVVAEAKNAASGEVVFNVNYTEAGEHTYTITEKSGTEAGVTYSTESHTVKVNVVDNGQGQLVATVENPNAERVFTNTYKAASTSATIKAKKVLNGKELVADAYTFELKEKDAVVAEAKNAASGEVVFRVDYTEAGEHTYTITEKPGTEAGVTYSTESYTVKVNVVDNGQGQLVATVENPNAERVFTNTYKEPAPTATSATLEFTKELTGRTLVDGEFQFELYKDGQKIDTKTNQGGKVTFNAISYDAEGEYTYTVKEVNAGATGITYDTEKTAVVKVTKDAATNTLKAAVEYPAGSVFKNSFKAPAVEATIEATKKLEGKELAADAYTFELKEKGAVVATAKNTAEGKVAFVRSFEEAGTYTYTLVEKVGTEEGIEYDKTEHTVTVTVVADDQGLLTAKVSYADGKAVVFTNKYTVPTPTPEPNPNPAPNNPGTTPDPAPTPDPTPNNPGTNPTPGTEPTDPGQKEDPKPAPPATETKGKAELPNTGEATSIFSAIGFVVLALSGLVFFVKRKA